MHTRRSMKIGMSIHWTLLRNIHFLHHHQNVHCFKAITILDMCTHVYAQCVHMRAHVAPIFFVYS